MPQLHKIAIIGCGNWGSAICRIVGENAVKFPDLFDKCVRMWVFEELVDGKKLSEIINNEHVNRKYLPDVKLPENVLAVPDLVESAKDATILIFAIPHQFVAKTCKTLSGKIREDAIGVSLIKGLSASPDGSARLISSEVRDLLNGKIEIAVLMGANLANEVAEDQFCEATIGTKNKKTGLLLKLLFDTGNFRTTVVGDLETVEVCGALKNVVACAVGFSDGLGYADTTKSALIRIGLVEMIRFIQYFFKSTHLRTFLESCGVADLITTCYGGRNRRCAAAMVYTGQSIEEVEKELLNGQKLQGPATAAQASEMIERANLLDEFPLFVAVHKVCKGQFKPEQMLDHIRSFPVETIDSMTFLPPP
uniref:Glycerol-3-phosphate dehydrogenase [NAD(+)] n=1 Tax=Romanomermis culicivorax TaxID=13658 RepID=A0A915L8K9_ROMCU